MIYLESIYIIIYLLLEKLKHFLGKSRYNCIKNVVSFLSKKNIIYTKSFQSLSTGTSILSEDELNLFKKYTDNVPYSPHDLYNINDIVNNINETCENKITLISDIPFKSGVIAVVYQGKINDKAVIIKVIRKNITDKLYRSLKVCECIIRFLNTFNSFKLYDLKTIFLENKNDIINQINFNKEIENNKIIYNNFKNIDYIKIPFIYDEYSVINNQVIVMDKIVGKSVYEVITDSDKKHFFNIFNKFIFKSILFNRTYHADLHPGNLFFIKENNTYSIGVIDFGLIGNINKSVQNDLFNFLKYIVIDKDVKQSSMLVINKLIDSKEHFERLSSIKQETIVLSINNILEDIIINNKHIDLDFIYNTNKLLQKYNLKLSRVFCKVELAIAVGSGISKYLTVDDINNTIYYDNLKQIIDEIANPKILDYD